MSRNSNTLPSKGILKQLAHPPKRDVTECSLPTNGGRAHFDEMNIIQTLHPENKDYGHMKIQEPKTPYHTYEEPTEGEQSKSKDKVRRASVDYNKAHPIDPSTLSNQLIKSQVSPLKSSQVVDSITDDEENERNKEFKAKRAAHYEKEFVKVKEISKDDE